MPKPLDVPRQITAMLAKGWSWSPADPDVLLHPADHGLYVRVNRSAGTLTPSPALAKALELVIPTPASLSRNFWRS